MRKAHQPGATFGELIIINNKMKRACITHAGPFHIHFKTVNSQTTANP